MIYNMESKKLFKLFQYNRSLTDEEKDEIICQPDILNSNKESFLHNYCKHKHCDINFMQSMLNNGYKIDNLNKDGYSMFYSCLFHNINYDKLNFLLDNFCPLVLPRVDINKVLLYDYFIIGNNKLDNNYFKLIQRIYGLDLFKKNLKDNYRYINLAYYCQNMEQLKWFDNSFNMNWDFDNIVYPKVNKYNAPNLISPLHHFLRQTFNTNSNIINILNNMEYFEYLCQKNQKILNKLETIKSWNSPNTTHTILEQVLEHGDKRYIDILYKYKVDDIIKNSNNLTGWEQLIRNIVANNITITPHLKYNYIWGILHKKIHISLGMIKMFKLTLNDCKNINEYAIHKNYKECAIHKNYTYFICKYSRTFLEDYPLDDRIYSLNDIDSADDFNEIIRNKFSQLKLLKFNKDRGYEQYTKEYCQGLKDEITEYLNKN